MTWNARLVPAPALVLLAACGDSTGPGARTGIMFQAVGQIEQQQLVVAGTNGTLRITDIRLIVDELELEPAETGDCDVGPLPAACEEFEARAFVVAVPVDGTPVAVSRSDIAPGLYQELEFEVDDLELDADETVESQEIQSLLATVRQEFPDWPETASMVVVGTFTPAGGSPVSFRAYFDAEIEVELTFQPPLQVSEADRTVVVEVRPESWFRRGDGSVLNLSLFDFQLTGQLIDFELEIENGFELEIGG